MGVHAAEQDATAEEAAGETGDKAEEPKVRETTATPQLPQVEELVRDEGAESGLQVAQAPAEDKEKVKIVKEHGRTRRDFIVLAKYKDESQIYKTIQPDQRKKDEEPGLSHSQDKLQAIGLANHTSKNTLQLQSPLSPPSVAALPKSSIHRSFAQNSYDDRLDKDILEIQGRPAQDDRESASKVHSVTTSFDDVQLQRRKEPKPTGSRARREEDRGAAGDAVAARKLKESALRKSRASAAGSKQTQRR